MRNVFIIGSVLVAALSGSTAAAQSGADDWDLTENAERRLIAASATFSTGVTIVLRCANGQYDALIGGLPPVATGTSCRTVSLQFGEGPASEGQWFVGTNPTAAISRLPARLARELRDGGMVKVRVADPAAGSRVRYDLDLPASAVNIDRTLAACDRPTEDVRDALVEDLGENGLPGGIEWARAPEPRYPSGRTFERGLVTLSCLNTPNGRLQDCVVESEYPLAGGFARSALAGLERARIRVAGAPDAPVPARMILFNVNFRMESESEAAWRGPETGTRLPRNR